MLAPLARVCDYFALSELRTRKTVFCVVFSAAAYVFHIDGFAAVVESWESLAAIGAGVYGAAHWRRSAVNKRVEVAALVDDPALRPGDAHARLAGIT